MERRIRLENDYSGPPTNTHYDEVRIYENPAFNSLDRAPFTADSSVFKNRPPKKPHVENTRSVSRRHQRDDRLPQSSSGRMRCLVALIILLLVLTVLCLGVTSYLCYKLIFENKTGKGSNGCDNDSIAEGEKFRSEWKITSENVKELRTNISSIENLKKNFTFLQEVINDLNSERRHLLESVKRLREEYERTRQHVLHNRRAISYLNISSLQQGDLSGLWGKLNSSENELLDVKKKVINMSKIVPPRGLPGYNGSQGRVGGPGPAGPPGLPGPGVNLTLCLYKKLSSKGFVSSSYARQSISITEKKGTRVISVHCDTNDAKTFQLESTIVSGQRKYDCLCDGTLSTGEPTMYCYMHYWECPT
ncbi:uncharacterized protein LOC111337930 [Stylophora pistillata]|uniref:Uncharacterized protein n=1 Tax=Stylophora pistillata TaxID=50429 RepID=A0A2B4RR51_STYPI|nr:uncharacterized protein LOC111337930 [Stylophora pistillata]PFX19646.1 hypothetical protein AWC38_SpisGene15922 [Stylophora pistillata]